MSINNLVNMQVKVLLFDVDGTLVDSMVVVERTWRNFAERHGLNLADILREAHGCRTIERVALFAPEHADVKEETARITIEEMEDLDGVTAIPGALELLNLLPVNRWALVTSADR